jgi:hypothetical protein
MATIVLAAMGAVALAAAPIASAAERVYWVAAVLAPTWNMAPNERDAINAVDLSPSQTVFPTVVYRRYTPHWGHPVRNAPRGSSNQDLIPGPLLRVSPSVSQSVIAAAWPLLRFAHTVIPRNPGCCSRSPSASSSNCRTVSSMRPGARPANLLSRAVHLTLRFDAPVAVACR